jgi:acyl transferase domain-containing protein
MTRDSPEVAVIGMACRCPGACDVEQLWSNLATGVESITRLSDADRRDAGVNHAVWNSPGYVRAAPLLEGYDQFDAAFFGYSPREAALLDPQQRIFLECAWTALEHAGYDAGGYRGAIGVYAGAALNTYLLFTGVAQRLRDDYLLALLASDKDFLTSRVSYKLGLVGPSVAVQTACSTSLVAVHLACQSLLGGECDMALAGGVAVKVPHRAGYRYEPDGPFSPDGHCRAFDVRAQGTLFGSGVGIVVLKPLAAALADGDTIHAVIKGSAINNDGSSKVDYAAPSVIGQAEVVAEALAHAGVEADTVAYVEAHGSGTALGDPVEVAALTKAFRRSTQRSGFCALGSVKTNVGHLDAAAGVIGLIKTVLALGHDLIPPNLHFEKPNPEIDFARTPFYVNAKSSPWPGARPRRAGVNSLGIGGTNAHVVVEEPPSPVSSADARPFTLLLISAKTATALDAATRNLGLQLRRDPAPSLADVGYTLQVGRKALPHRRMLVCRDRADAISALDAGAPNRVHSAHPLPKARPVVFLFPGAGRKHPPAIADLHAAEPLFAGRIDRGLAELATHSDYDFARLLLGAGGEARLVDDFARPTVQLPALFLVEDALAALWMSWGIQPSALLGHSMGEITAAGVAGVLGFADALRLVVARAELVERTPHSGMLSVALPIAEVGALLEGEIDIASVNTPGSCVLSGTMAALETLRGRLIDRGADARWVPLASAGHSRLLDPFLAEYEARVARATLRPPSIPLLSSLTGTWLTDEQATDPGYWARQYRHTVRFADGARELLGHPDRLLVEVGTGQTLSTFVHAQRDLLAGRLVVPSLPSPPEAGSNVASLYGALGRLWLAGADVDWMAFNAYQRRRRVPLPTYPFERERHWYDEAVEPVRRGERLRSLARRGAALAKDALALLHKETPARSAADTPPRSETAAVAPRTATERQVAEIWQDVLGSRRMSIHDDFFELGGNSLLVAKVIARVNQAYRIDLSLLTMFESPTVAELARCIEAIRNSAVTMERSTP